MARESFLEDLPLLRIYAIPPTTTARIRQAITTGNIGLRVLAGLGARFLRSLMLLSILLLTLSLVSLLPLSSIEASAFESVTLSSIGASGFTSVELSSTLSICALVLLLLLSSIEVSTFISVVLSSDFTLVVLSSASSETFVKKRLLIAASVATF